MRVLAIDTATTDLVTGIVDTAARTCLDRVVEDTRAHNEQLIPTVQALLADASLTFPELDAIVVGCGPGPFTGLRVGMSTAQALGHALGVPVHGVCSLDAIGAESAGRLLVATDARRKEVYWAAYQDGSRIDGPGVIAPEHLADKPADNPADKPGKASAEEQAFDSAPFESVIIPEHLAPRLPKSLAQLPRSAGNPRAAGLVAVADLESTPAPLVPLYLRRPDAKEPKPQPQSPAIPKVEL